MGLKALKVLIRGAGEMASGVGVRLHKANLRVVFTEISEPLCVRRTVSFTEALHQGRATVENVEAVSVSSPDEVPALWNQGRTAVLIDPQLASLSVLKPDVIVDAILAKKNLGLRPDLAPLVIGLGPGFTAGRDARIVIETNRGHDLGRLIFDGQAAPNTGVPGTLGGQSIKRVLRAPADGRFETELDIGVSVVQGQQIGRVGDSPVYSGLDGILRGMIRPGTKVFKGLKIGDVDPRGQKDYCWSVSDKARAIGGSVLEAIMGHFNR